MIRLDKYLADMGIGTRSQIKKAMRKGVVEVNGDIVKDSSFKVEEGVDEVVFDGFVITYEKYVYFMLNKPKGYISSTSDTSTTVMELIMEPYKDMFPCGRLDKDTTGLLLITNDGQLAHELLSPNHHVEKEYLVHSAKPLSKEDMELFTKGMVLDGNEEIKPARIFEEDTCVYHVMIKEGKYHQIKRMFECCDNEVVELKRLRMKNLVLDADLEEGQYRPLTQDELDDLKNN